MTGISARGSIPAILPPHAQIVLQGYLPSLIDTTVSLMPRCMVSRNAADEDTREWSAPSPSGWLAVYLVL
jgi:hypothetical protein